MYSHYKYFREQAVYYPVIEMIFQQFLQVRTFQKDRLCNCFVSYLFSCLFVSAPAWAQDESQVQVLEPIQVEGYQLNRKMQQQDYDFSRSFSTDRVFSEQLQEESIGDIKEAIKDLPNVQVTEQGAFIKSVKIRGLSGDRIQSVIDGVRLNNQGMTHAGGGELNLLDIASVDSIEVIKGSPSVMYAPGASGGVINVNLKSLPNEDSVQAGYTFTYDDGYEKTKHSTYLTGAWKGLGASVLYSNTDANAYKVRDQEKLDETIERTNVIDERQGTEYEIQNLGYSDESWQARAEYRVNDQHRFFYNYGNYQGEDIAFTHGAATSQVFYYDFFNRLSHVAGYELNNVSVLDELTFTYSSQKISRGTFQGVGINETILKSDSFQLKAFSDMGDGVGLNLGFEYTKDKAETNVLAEQDYYAGYFNFDYIWGDWSFSTGLRSNYWNASQDIIDNRNSTVIEDLVGVSGKVDDVSNHALTYAFGMIYSVTPSNNISFNYSRTYRFPSLYERFAFDNFIGGGAELQAEKGHNFELSWKYLDDPWFARIALFYNKFDDYLGTVPRRTLTNPEGLRRCIARGRCNPVTGDYDDRENDFFSSQVFFENLGVVVNKGFEVSSGLIVEDNYEAGLNVGLNDIEADNVFAQINSNPLEINAYFKKIFPFIPLKPWVKLNARYVTDWPKVTQDEGFNPFFTLDAYVGVRYLYADQINFAINFGVRNLTDAVYHEAYSALDGVKRTMFGNVSIQIKL